jgi:OmpA-OmpF porin, OOP family
MKKSIASALLLCAVAAAPAYAAQPNAFYGAIEAGSWTQRNSVFTDPGVIVVAGGYRFNPNLAVELGLYMPGKTTIDSGGGNTVTARQSAFRASAVGTIPLGEKFDLFGKIGLASIYAEQYGTGNTSAYSTETTSNVAVGFGGQFNINRSFGVRVQYESLGQRKLGPTTTAIDISVTSVGFVYTF